jgi:hypothetical protein
MIDPHSIANQVLRNCDISDARHAGLFSICGLALRLRDLYKWDTHTPPWRENPSDEVLAWIGRKEELWENLVENDYLPIDIDGRSYPPFETLEINAVLLPHGLFYGAGYAYSLKPTFFLAAVTDRQEIDGIPVYTLGPELARDLMTLPALSQDDRVVLRTEATGLYLWDKILYVKKSGRRALGFALDRLGISDHRPRCLRHRLADILAVCRETFIYHEIGEILDPVFSRSRWREIVADFPHTGVELLARHVKDLLADTGQRGPLRRMIQNRQEAALGFYTAFIDGLALELFPELRLAFDEFCATGSWRVIDAAVTDGHAKARTYATDILSIYRTGKDRGDLQWAADTIEERLLQPLSAAPAAA